MLTVTVHNPDQSNVEHLIGHVLRASVARFGAPHRGRFSLRRLTPLPARAGADERSRGVQGLRRVQGECRAGARPGVPPHGRGQPAYAPKGAASEGCAAQLPTAPHPGGEPSRPALPCPALTNQSLVVALDVLLHAPEA